MLVLLAALVLSSCGTPQAVKDLSTAQLQAQGEMRKQLGAYFEVIETVVSTQIDTAETRIDELTAANIADRRKLAVIEAKGSIERADDPALIKLGNNIEADLALRDSLKAKLRERLAMVKAKHKELRDAYQVFYEAQEKLDEYIRLEKAEERVFDALLGTVGISKDKLNRAVTDLAGTTDAISNLLRSVDDLKK